MPSTGEVELNTPWRSRFWQQHHSIENLIWNLLVTYLSRLQGVGSNIWDTIWTMTNCCRLREQKSARSIKIFHFFGLKPAFFSKGTPLLRCIWHFCFARDVWNQGVLSQFLTRFWFITDLSSIEIHLRAQIKNNRILEGFRWFEWDILGSDAKSFVLERFAESWHLWWSWHFELESQTYLRHSLR